MQAFMFTKLEFVCDNCFAVSVIPSKSRQDIVQYLLQFQNITSTFPVAFHNWTLSALRRYIRNVISK